MAYKYQLFWSGGSAGGTPAKTYDRHKAVERFLP